MPQWYRFVRLGCWITLLGLCGHISTAGAHADLVVSGKVVDHNGNAVDQAIVTIGLSADHGPDFSTVFSDQQGAFTTGAMVSVDTPGHVPVIARKLGHKQIHHSMHPGSDPQAIGVRLIMGPVLNQVGAAPASAWLAGVEPDQRAQLIRACAGCHQLPSPPMRHFSRLIEDSIIGLPGVNPSDARRESWAMIEQYMVILTNEALVRSNGASSPKPAGNAASTTPPLDSSSSSVAGILAEYFDSPMSAITGYDYGAPILATPETMISEYRIRDVDTIHDAVLQGSSSRLWTVGNGRHNGLISVDPNTGERRRFEIPLIDNQGVTPDGLQRGTGDTLWITSSGEGVVARFDTADENWLGAWQLKDEAGVIPAISELGLGPGPEVEEDKLGRIWFCDSVGNALGYFAPATGETRLFPVPLTEQRFSASSDGLGGIIMSPDRKFVWYSQPGGGSIGAIHTEKLEFRTVSLQEPLGMPGRGTMAEGGILYVPLFDTGQLLEHNTSTGEQTVHDLPDRSSAPASAIFDPIRKLVWVTTVNGDAVYRFDPAVGAFSLLPLPRQGGYLHKISLDRDSGILAGAYLNRGGQEQTLNMALTIKPGDGAYPEPVVRSDEEKGDAE